VVLRLELEPVPTVISAAAAAATPAKPVKALELLVVAQPLDQRTDRACDFLPVVVPCGLTVRQLKAELLTLLRVTEYATAIVDPPTSDAPVGNIAPTTRPVSINDFTLSR